MRGIVTDVLVVGGGVGGVAAALAALRHGARVVLSEETDWLGGQLTSQMVPPDEHPWIEQFGASVSYRRLRELIRAYYRDHYPLDGASLRHPRLNPGAGGVGPLCHEPRVALAVIEGLLAPWVAGGQLTVLLQHRAVAVAVDGDRVQGVCLRSIVDGSELDVEAGFVLEATETGELLPLSGTEYVTGAEARFDTGELNAPEIADPLNMQAASVCFAISHHPGEDHTILRPDDYEHWSTLQPEYWPGTQFGWVGPHPHTLAPRRYSFLPNPDDRPWELTADQSKDNGADELWTFRRILARNHFSPGRFDSDITVVNWPMIDYLGGPLFEVPEEEAAFHLQQARRQSLSFLYWLQHDAPREDGRTGWPGLRLRPDVSGTSDGLAKTPYLRESRRILAQYRIVEQDLSVAARGERGAMVYPDSVGVGAYRIDLHPSTGGDNYIDVPAWPFQIPLRSLLPQRVENLIVAGKSLGTTHITNGCYRLHPVEWSAGEAAGSLAAYCLRTGTHPHSIADNDARLAEFQQLLAADGVELSWPEVRYY